MPLTSHQIEETARCLDGLDGFKHFCANYIQILNKETKRWVPFELWPVQVEVAEMLIDKDWIVALKARQIGMTWLARAYILYCITFEDHFLAMVLSQSLGYANDFLWFFREMWLRMPKWLRPEVSPDDPDNTSRMMFNVGGKGCEIRSLAGSKKTGRSLTGDFVVFDEGAFMEELAACRAGCEPTLEASGGQVMAISTSNGPANDFATLWSGAPENGYKAVFHDWRARPGRDDAWHEREASKHEDDPLYMRREFPNTPQEAFELGPGRVYSRYMSERNNVDADHKAGWQHYRAIDFGMTERSPFVCLWIAYRDGPPCLTVARKCVETNRMMLAYRRNNQTGELLKKDDHCPDCIRYAVTTFQLTGGHLHVYREYVIYGSDIQGLSTPQHAAKIQELSKWTEVSPHRWVVGDHGEKYTDTVADRSGINEINILNDWGIVTCPAINICTMKSSGHAESTRTEREQGVIIVNSLVIGTVPIHGGEIVNPEAEYIEYLKSESKWHKQRLRGAKSDQNSRWRRELARRRLSLRRHRKHDILGNCV